MTKNELVDHVANQTQRTKKEAEQSVESVLGAIGEALERGEKVDLRGFGSFQVNARNERPGRNPRTGETMTIAARNAAVFKPSKELTARVNQKNDTSVDAKSDADTLPIAEPSSEKAKSENIGVATSRETGGSRA